MERLDKAFQYYPIEDAEEPNSVSEGGLAYFRKASTDLMQLSLDSEERSKAIAEDLISPLENWGENNGR